MKILYTSKKNAIWLSVLATTTSLSLHAQETTYDNLYDALSHGSVFGNLNLRYESVEQDNILQDASASTFRTRLGYQTGSLNGFSVTVEMEDNRIVLGEGDYSVPPTGYNTGIYSVIADPEHTELDQGFIQYKNQHLTVKLGRQVITHDGHRFIGHVGWRQDRQTFDAATVIYAPTQKMQLSYSFIDQRNGIFAEVADTDSSDHLLHASYKTDFGALTAYGYLLEADLAAGLDNSLDTYGARFSGATPMHSFKALYHVEYAKQTNRFGASDFDADYLNVEAGVVVSGITAKLGYELLGSDDGQYGFQTPLATLHKFNGWTDQFLKTPIQGLVDTSFTLSGKLAGGTWLAVYHDFDADESTAQVDDLGKEINLQYLTKFAKHYTVGVKFATYSGASQKVDTDKLWVWLSTAF
ncbi:alginate export family protein [Alteromonas oceanisediminis]|uniref:alginate export family protein n=1 Tax=Alteromonas oceanisediminis TaxID=2836180 RepID=UPI001BD9A34B|nr:alginate export family protein [Alteromonas oceanisediminis]MBT0586022.1 alginate export family protein [Alteromonas oceanisediminis]